MQARSSGRVVILTGAAGGIGRVMSEALLADGHSVAAVDRDADGLDRLAAAAQAAGAAARLLPIVANLFSEADCGRAVEAAINNAGIGMSSIRPDAEARHPTIEELAPQAYARGVAAHEGARFRPH